MKRAAILGLVAAIAAGCGGTPKNVATQDDLRAVEERQSKALSEAKSELNLKVSESVVELEKRYSTATKTFAEMQSTYQEMKNTLEEVKKLRDDVQKSVADIDKKVTTANANLIVVLEAEEKLLGDRLAEIRRTLEALKK
jgi:septation ring formation regulator EzrA